jgi:hypothetical protein
MSDDSYRQVEKDLLFYFNHSSAAIGFKSSHASFVAAVYGVSATVVDTDPYTDGLLRQVRKIRTIRNTFFSLPQETQRVLESIYNLEYHYQYPVELVAIYGNKTGAVFFNDRVLELKTLILLCKKKKLSKLSAEEQVLMFNIGEDARKLWDNAHQAYLDSKQTYLNIRSKK